MCIMTTYFDFNNENCIMTTLKSHDVYFIVYIKLCQKGTMSDHLTCLTFKWRTISNWNQYVTHEDLLLLQNSILTVDSQLSIGHIKASPTCFVTSDVNGSRLAKYRTKTRMRFAGNT